MNIAILSTSDITGGAARAAYRLHEGFSEIGERSNLIVRYKHSTDKDVHAISSENEHSIEERVFMQIERWDILENRTALSETYFSFPYPGFDISHQEMILQSDVINLHWINKFQSVETIGRLISLGKPIIWTLHDQWPFTGGCHYTAGCEGYKVDCGNCPQLRDNTSQIPFKVLQNKIRTFGNKMTVVTPSRWLADCATQSSLFKKTRIEVIPYSLDTNTYKPIPKAKAKSWFGTPPAAFTFLFVAEQLEKRKGFIQLLEALNFCSQDAGFQKMVAENKIQILSFGKHSKGLREFNIPVKELGYLQDEATIVKAYSAADVFVLPTLEDNLPNTMLEALSCGTSVIAYETGGVGDVVQKGINGYIVPKNQPRELGRCMIELACHPDKCREYEINGRALMESEYHLTTQSKRYASLFKELQSRHTARNFFIKQQVCAPNESDRGKLPVDDPVEICVELFPLYRHYTLDLLESFDKCYAMKIGRAILYPLKLFLSALRIFLKKIQF